MKPNIIQNVLIHLAYISKSPFSSLRKHIIKRACWRIEKTFQIKTPPPPNNATTTFTITISPSVCVYYEQQQPKKKTPQKTGASYTLICPTLRPSITPSTLPPASPTSRPWRVPTIGAFSSKCWRVPIASRWAPWPAVSPPIHLEPTYRANVFATYRFFLCVFAFRLRSGRCDGRLSD